MVWLSFLIGFFGGIAWTLGALWLHTRPRLPSDRTPS